MKLKKTWFGWLNFLIGTLFMSVFLFTLLVSLFEFNGFTTSLFGLNWLKSSFLISGAVILGIVGLYLLIHFLKKNLHVKDGTLDRIGLPVMWILFSGLLVAGIYLRLDYLRNITSLDLFNQTAYEKILYVFDGNRLNGLDFFSNIYYLFEAFLLKIFGIKVLVPIISNMVFQIFAFSFLFISVFVSYGKSSAILGFGYLMLFETPIKNMLNISSDSFLLLITSFVILCVSLTLRERRNGLMKSNSNIILFIIFGIIFGALIYSNPVFIILPVYYCLCIGLQIKTENMGDLIIEKKPAPIFTIIVSSIITVLTLFGINSCTGNYSITYLLMDYMNKFGFSDYVRIYYPASYIIECVIIMAFCLIAYVSFIFKKYDNISAITFLLALTYFVYSKNVSSVNVSMVLLELFGIASGIGIKAYLFDDYTVVEETLEMPVELISDVEEKVLSENENDTHIEDNNDAPVSDDTVENKADNPIEETGKRDFVPIKNVLPLPKKHVKKEIGYAFEPSPNEMKYDYEVRDDDDYDI